MNASRSNPAAQPPPGQNPRAVRAPTASFIRRLGAAAYDSVLVAAILFLATVLALPLNDGEAYSPASPGYTTYLLAIGFVYFGWFWTRNGQTLGMKTWGIRVVTTGGDRLRWSQALTRYAAALVSVPPLGPGFLWVLIDREGMSWHDRLSRTVLILTR